MPSAGAMTRSPGLAVHYQDLGYRARIGEQEAGVSFGAWRRAVVAAVTRHTGTRCAARATCAAYALPGIRGLRALCTQCAAHA